MALDDVELALEAGAHRAARAVELRAGVELLLAQLEELAHAAGEDALDRRRALRGGLPLAAW